MRRRGGKKRSKTPRSGDGSMRGWLAALLAAVLGIVPVCSAAAEDHPTRPVTMIVPFPAGGATDTLARFLGERLNAVPKQPWRRASR